MRKWSEEELELVPCDYCSKQNVSPTYKRRDGMAVVECRLCGLAYLNPRPKAELIKYFYEKEYFDGSALNHGDGGLNVKKDNTVDQTGKGKIINRRISLINEQIGDIRGKKVLEVGCATGDMLYALRCQGAHVHGVEISKHAATIARGRGLNVTDGEVEDYASGTDETFDLIVAYEVIEHVTSPGRFLMTLVRLVKPKGWIILDTPNLRCAHRFGNDWYGFQTSFEHLYFFSLDTINRYAINAGLKITYWESSIYDGSHKRPKSHHDRVLNKIDIFFFLLSKVGVARLYEIIKKKESTFYPYGDGHVLQVVMQKHDIPVSLG